jgi:hypothetical protein
MDVPATIIAPFRYRRWLPYWAVLRTDVRQTVLDALDRSYTGLVFPDKTMRTALTGRDPMEVRSEAIVREAVTELHPQLEMLAEGMRHSSLPAAERAKALLDGVQYLRDTNAITVEEARAALARWALPPLPPVETEEDKQHRIAAVVEEARREAARREDNATIICPCGVEFKRGRRWQFMRDAGRVQADDTQLWHCGKACTALVGHPIRKLPED